MVTALGIFFLPFAQTFTARRVVYVIVTLSTSIALLAFSYLELRAHRNE